MKDCILKQTEFIEEQKNQIDNQQPNDEILNDLEE